jgi:Transposase and inactivated derivatives
VSVLREEYPMLGMESLCGLFGYSRQAYYQHVSENEYRDNAITPLIFDAVQNYRKHAPKIGILKLHYLISNLFKDERVPGRDAFFNLMRENGFVLRKRKTKKTTNSRHHFRKFDNLIVGFEPTAPNQLWVSDITYLETADGTCYLSLVTDACSHKIVGWAVGETLEALHPVSALRMALESLNDKITSGLIHHSDRGVQYCCNQYVHILQENNVRISMTQSGDPLENAIAERVNGILKGEWLNDLRLKDLDDSRKELTRIIAFYNNERPHMSVDMQTPSLAHTATMKFKSRWKKSVKERQAVEKKDLLCKTQGEAVIV